MGSARRSRPRSTWPPKWLLTPMLLLQLLPLVPSSGLWVLTLVLTLLLPSVRLRLRLRLILNSLSMGLLGSMVDLLVSPVPLLQLEWLVLPLLEWLMLPQLVWLMLLLLWLVLLPVASSRLRDSAGVFQCRAVAQCPCLVVSQSQSVSQCPTVSLSLTVSRFQSASTCLKRSSLPTVSPCPSVSLFLSAPWWPDRSAAPWSARSPRQTVWPCPDRAAGQFPTVCQWRPRWRSASPCPGRSVSQSTSRWPARSAVWP